MARPVEGTIQVTGKDKDHGQADPQRRRAGAQGVHALQGADSHRAQTHNDIQIDNLAVSGEHAAIITILNDSFIEDLGSTNGTMVNGKPIKKHFLQNNDVVELGKHKLKYFNDRADGRHRPRTSRRP
jgi:pSer/pThr/pTyr-binding forkhead associated (FHA) protein